MSLFSHEDLLTPKLSEVKENKAFGIYLKDADLVVSLGKSKDALKEVVGNLKDQKNRMVVSDGAWSMHDLLFYALEATGPAAVDLVTWQVSQRSIRMLAEGLDKGLITGLNCLLDRRTPIRRSGEMAYIETLANKIHLVDCHAKITLVANEGFTVSIFSSANMTKNKRVEFFIVYFDRYIFDFNKDWFTKQLEGAHPFEL